MTEYIPAVFLLGNAERKAAHAHKERAYAELNIYILKKLVERRRNKDQVQAVVPALSRREQRKAAYNEYVKSVRKRKKYVNGLAAT